MGRGGPEFGAFDGDDRDGGRSCVARRVERGDDVRRAAARAQPDDRIGGVDAQLADGAGACLAVVLRLLLRGGGRGRPACDQGDDAPGRDGERGLAFGGVDDGEPSRRPGTDVDEPAARGEPRGDGIDRRGDRARRPVRRLQARPRRPRSSGRRARPCSGGRDPRPVGRGPPSRARRRPSLLPLAPSRRPVYAT